MKTKRSILALVMAIGFAIAITSCGNAQKQNEEADSHEKMEHMDHANHDMEVGHDMHENKPGMQSTALPKEQASKVLASYLKIKNSLVKSDGETASKAAFEIVKTLEGTNDELAKQIHSDAEHISHNKDTEHQREHFNTLSENIYSLVKATEANGSTLYRQYCPMAFNNKGAFWLSSEKEINNPYFGDKMLHCGSVKEEL